MLNNNMLEKESQAKRKPVLMIHEMTEEMLDLPLHDYVLTFDDGLYTQYKFLDRLRAIDTEKIFFVSSGIVCRENQSHDFITCRDAHKKAFNSNFENYMTIDQLKEIVSSEGCWLGGHSHSHTRLSTFNSLSEQVAYIKRDTEEMLAWFEKNLNLKIEKFCFPYNEDLDKLYAAVLKRYDIRETYGRERIPIETLLHS
jgi:hypothetical protein